MKYFVIFLLIIGGVYFFNGCEQKQEPGAVKEIDISVLKREINLIMQQDTSAQWLKELPKKFFDTLKTVYAGCGNYPLWIESLSKTAAVKHLLDYLGASGDHGILPARYGYELLSGIYNQMIDTGSAGKFIDYKNIAKLETGLSLAFLQYETDLTRGIVNQDSLGEDNGDTTRSLRLPDVIANLRSPQRIETLDSVQPRRPQYIALQKELKALRKIENDSAAPMAIPPITGKIEKGKSSSAIPPIADKLKYYGLIDTGYRTSLPPVYDTTLLAAVKKFQYRVGLLNDGVIGMNTIDQLNMTPSKRIETIRANLERLRWNCYPDSGNFVLVNIPEFKLHAYRDGKPEKEIKVCTGQKREKNYELKKALYEKTKKWVNKPKNFETPRVASKIFLIITNPRWAVPASIAKNETYYEIMKDSNYLARMNFKVFKNGKQVDYTTIDWKKVSPSTLQYDFVQDPGEANALGKIKFIFRNKYSIYLHDTPTRAPFQYGNRAVSHGCVRLEKPMELADYLLKENREFNLDDIKCELAIKPVDETKMEKYKAKLNSGKKKSTREFTLEKSVPLYIDYYTAWVDNTGLLRFAPDVYAKDQRLLNALDGKEASAKN